MRRVNNPYIENLPSIDVHGLDRISAVLKVEDFINDNLKLRTYNIIIIHGKGSGTLRKEIHNYLKKNKYVEDYKTDYFNEGITLIKLKE